MSPTAPSVQGPEHFGVDLSELAEQMDLGEEILRENRNLLRRLAR